MSLALFLEAESFLALPAWVFKLVWVYLHVCTQVAFVGTFFVAPFVTAFPFLTMSVEVSIEVRVSNETLVTFVALESVVRLLVFVWFKFTFKVKRLQALVTLVVATEVHVRMSDKRIQCVIHLITDIAWYRWVVPSMMVIEIVYWFEVLVAIQTGVISHFIDLEFPYFVFVWGGGLVVLPDGIFANCMSFSELGFIAEFSLVGLLFVSLSVLAAQQRSL